MKDGDSFEIIFYISDDRDKVQFKGEFSVNELKQLVNEDGSFTYKILALDLLGNELDDTNEFNTGATSVKYDGQAPTDPIIASVKVNENGREETIRIGGSTDDLSGVVEYQYKSAKIRNFGEVIWTDWKKCNEGYEIAFRGEHKVKVRAIDAAGNVSKEIERMVGPDSEPPVIQDISISKVEENPANNDVDYVKLGDKFKVSFNLYDRSGILDQSVKININSVEIVGKNLGGGNYEAEFQVAEKNSTPPADESSETPSEESTEPMNLVAGEDDKPFEFKIFFADSKGNSNKDNPESQVFGKGKDSKVIYYAPIKATIDSFSSMKEQGDTSLVKNGEKVRVTFTANYAVEIAEGKIAGKNAEIKNIDGDNRKWEAIYTIEGGELKDGENIAFSFKVKDAADNTPLVIKELDTENKVTYMAPIKATITAFSSNNKNSQTVARNGDRINLTFATTHPVKVSKLSIGGKELSGEAKSSDNMNWSVEYLVTPGDVKDQQLIAYSFTLTDAAANTPFSFTSGDDDMTVKYFEPIMVSNLKIVSNNGIDGSKYAKDGDTITITFDTQHKTHISASKIAGKNIEFTSKNNEGKNWTGKYSLKNGDIADLQQVSFQFKVDDEAANDTLSKDHESKDVTNKLKYYAPITVTASIASSGNNKDYAKNGDTIKVSFTTNHEVKVSSSAFFNGRSGRAGGNDTSTLTAEFTIPAGESVLKEDVVPFAISVEDPAGNTNSFSETNDGSKVIYDRTSPVAVISPAFNGFSGKALNVTVSCSDKNIDPKAVSVTLNGNELMSAAERAAAKATFDKEVNLQEEGEYHLKVVSTDMAGNKSDPNVGMKVILDMTNPKFTSMQLDLTKAITVKKGFIISEFIIR